MHYWIDGYNLLFRFPSQGTSLEEKREQLVKYMQNFAQLLKLQVTLVFDSGKQDIYARSHYKALEIIYTTPETTADHFLLDMISSSTTPQALCIVTSDKPLAKQAKALQAHTLSLEGFISLLHKKSQNRRGKGSSLPLQESPQEMQRLLVIFEKALYEKGKDLLSEQLLA